MSAEQHRLYTLLGAHAAKFPHHTAQRFPHVVDRLADLWGTPAIDGYFSELMVADDRRKQGFPPEVALEIFALNMLHDSLFPKAVARSDAWVEATERERAGRTRNGSTPSPDKQ
jgi:hypothetical protein